jgi:hypothetical protein
MVIKTQVAVERLTCDSDLQGICRKWAKRVEYKGWLFIRRLRGATNRTPVFPLLSASGPAAGFNFLEKIRLG